MMKKIFIIDWCLLSAFLLSAFSGIGLHIAGEIMNHERWHNWAVVHVLTSALFLIAILFHVFTHRSWYTSLIRSGMGRKSRATFLLSVLFLLVAITGIALLQVEGANSRIGLWHYKMGITTMMICVGHTLKRFPVLRKSLKRRGS